jgi:DNA-binding beta-propeller fold protein YncE
LQVMFRRYLIGLIAAVLVLAGCNRSTAPDPTAQPVKLPDAAQNIDFDDVTYSPETQLILVPARDAGAYLVDPRTGQAKRLPAAEHVDSIDSGQGLLFVLNRNQSRIRVLDPNGNVLSSVSTSPGTDYVRYAASTSELLVTEPALQGLEIFALGKTQGEAPRQVGFIPVPGGTEGLTLTSDGATAYTHAGNDVARIDITSRAITARWPTGCDGTHGFPRINEKDGLLLASCANKGKVTLLDLNDGHQLDEYELGEGEALPAYSTGTGHFYIRSDPGAKIVTLSVTRQGLDLVREVQVPETGHCLGADDQGRYFTCDANAGQILLFHDP